MNALTPLPANDDGAITEPVPGSLLNFVARAMADPAIDVNKLEMLLRMQREIVAEDARVQFHKAMNATQGEMQAVVRNAVNDQTRSKYATLEAVDAAIRPVYARHGFSLSFTETPNEGPELRIACTVRHSAGHVETYSLSALSDMVGPQGKPNKTQVQGVGSSVSYLRRYLTCMIFNVALRDDNDGNKPKPNSDTGELAGAAQSDELRRLLVETNSDERKFLDHMNLRDVRSIKDVPAGHFTRLRNALLTKKDILAQRAARAANAQTQMGKAS
jgi:hypothetical protein